MEEMSTYRKILLLAASFLAAWGLSAQAPEDVVRWSVAQDGDAIVFTGKIQSGWHVYDLKNEQTATYVEYNGSEGWAPVGEPYEISESRLFDGTSVFFDEMVFAQKISAEGNATISGTLTYQACNDRMCTPPIDWDFSIEVAPAAATADSTPAPSEELPEEYVASHSTAISDPEEGASGKTSLWALIIEAILWGFAMFLTPCVFPMVPMTISFFVKGSSSAAEGRFKAFMYGLFIVLLYTVPISIIIGLTWIIGGNAVTADIFNWLSTHWLPNIIFFVVFMIFAASLFGAFEITMPSKMVNDSDRKSSRKGLGGIFFLALTLVLVSFSCTGPIVGTVLIKSTEGEFWTPMVTMLAFSVAFALPFTVLALFPSLLKKMKSGSWLNSVKVVLGFIEIALGFKFLSVADQTYHWGLLNRPIYLAIWIVTFSLLGFYLLGKLRFKNDDKVEYIGVGRLALAIAVFSFVVWMIPGMFGAPLKALSGYLPPMETQDFVVYSHSDGPLATAGASSEPGSPTGKYGLKMPLGLNGYFTLEEGLAASKAAGKPVFVDITGHGCVNCREMEQRVWSDPKVLDILRNDYILVALYTDDKTRLDEADWVTTESGKVIKDLGRANAYLVRERFGVNAQPNYALLDSDGNQMVPVRGYNLDVDAFVEFLQKGLDEYRKK